jgi:uncharacterized protein (DUF433 family)
MNDVRVAARLRQAVMVSLVGIVAAACASTPSSKTDASASYGCSLTPESCGGDGCFVDQTCHCDCPVRVDSSTTEAGKPDVAHCNLTPESCGGDGCFVDQTCHCDCPVRVDASLVDAMGTPEAGGSPG